MDHYHTIVHGLDNVVFLYYSHVSSSLYTYSVKECVCSLRVGVSNVGFESPEVAILKLTITSLSGAYSINSIHKIFKSSTTT